MEDTGGGGFGREMLFLTFRCLKIDKLSLKLEENQCNKMLSSLFLRNFS